MISTRNPLVICEILPPVQYNYHCKHTVVVCFTKIEIYLLISLCSVNVILKHKEISCTVQLPDLHLELATTKLAKQSYRNKGLL